VQAVDVTGTLINLLCIPVRDSAFRDTIKHRTGRLKNM